MIKPKIGRKVKFNIWHDLEYLGKVYTEPGDGINRPSNFNDWIGIVVKIEQTFINLNKTNTYIIKRDFDGEEMPFYVQDLVGYVD